MSDPEEFDALAGEYVLGTLSADERAQAETRQAAEPAFAAAVADWDRRLAPLLEASPDIDPPAGIFARIESRLFGAAAAAPRAVSGPDVLVLRRRLRRWQTACAGATALAAALAVWVVVVPPRNSDVHQFVAVLQKDPGSTAIVLDIDTVGRRLTIRPVAASSPADRSLELWLIPGNGTPRSLGTVSPTGITRASLSAYDPQTIEGATYAVTLEPAGGSPSGQPTSTPLVSGHGTAER